MKKNTPKTTNIPESNGAQQTSYEKLLEKLDHSGFANSYYRDQLERAKSLVHGIISITSGTFETDDKESGANNLLELLEILMIRHQNFQVYRLAEDLQDHIFIYTQAYSKSFDQWKTGVFAERHLDENGIIPGLLEDEDAEFLDLSECAPEHLNARISELSDAKDLACALSGVLKNPLLPVQLYNIITDEISLIGDNDTPENILFNFEQMNKKEGESQ